MNPALRKISRPGLKLLVPLLLLAHVHGLRAQPRLDTSSPVGFFTNCANLLLNTAGYNFTVTNIPVFDGTNFVYSPAVHRLLQLSANIFDCTTNRVFSDGTSPNGPFFPSVFRPTFNRSGNSIFINGYVEEGDGTTSYFSPPLSLPQDLALVDATTTTNIYGVPWVIGARTGFPNFNQFDMETVAQITRRLEVDKIAVGTPRTGWITNQMYVIGISNLLAVEAWNPYTNNYPRAVRLLGTCILSMTLTNDQAIMVATNVTNGWLQDLDTNQWSGFVSPLSPFTNPGRNAASFLVPLQTNFVFLPDSIWRETVASLDPLAATNQSIFENTGTFPLPRFSLSVSNRLRYIMLDTATGRVLDYVHLDGINSRQDLLAESASASPGGLYGNSETIDSVWNTNRPGGTFNIASPTTGILNQIAISQGNITLGPADWANSQLPGANSSSETTGFSTFINSPATATNLVRQAPYSPTRKMVLATVFQANDPLVHYHLSDLGMTSSFSMFSPAATAPLSLTNVGALALSARYSPWLSFRGPYSPFDFNLAIKDPLIRSANDWNFPTNQPLDFRWLGQVHRGAPWQTFYLKSSQIDLATWRAWTCYTNMGDLSASLPANDWKLAAQLVQILNPTYPRHLVSVNQTNLDRWDNAFTGLTILTNPPGGLTSFTLDTGLNSDTVAGLASAIAAGRNYLPGQIYTNLDQVLAVPALSVASPFLDFTSPDVNELTDAAYEALPAQLLPLLRTDSVGTIVSTAGPLQIQFTGYDGFAYLVEASPDLMNWTPIGTNYTTNGSFVFSDTPGPGQRFYRTRLAP